MENLVCFLQVFLKECKYILHSNDSESFFDVYFWGRNFEAINLLQKSDLNKKEEIYKKKFESIYKNG